MKRGLLLLRSTLVAVSFILVLSISVAAQPPSDDSRFIVAVIPDTQRYAAYNINVFKSQTQWIADHAAERDIRFTIHVGDITENDAVVEEWQGADEAMKILEDAGMPYAIVPGNHDIVNEVPDDQRDFSQEMYPTYFPPERAASSPTYGGHSSNGMNSYYIFNAEGQDFLVIGLDYLPSQSAFDWASDIMAQHPTLPVILVAHDIVTSLCNLGDEACTNGGILSQTGQRIWDDVVFEHDQIFLTVNGHSWPPENIAMPNAAGHDVNLILTNYQAEHYGGNGMLRLLEFDLAANTITATTISPWVLQKPENRRTKSDVIEKTDTRNQFTLNVDFAARFADFAK